MDVAPLEAVCGVILRAYRSGNQVMVMGNGASAALASHMACDLCKWTRGEGGGLQTRSLTDNLSLLTACANDDGYETIFAQQISSFARRGDVVIGISSSGESLNVLNGLEAARKKGAVTVGMTRVGAERMKSLCDYCLTVPSDMMQCIEDVHCVLVHAICLRVKDLVEQERSSHGDADCSPRKAEP